MEAMLSARSRRFWDSRSRVKHPQQPDADFFGAIRPDGFGRPSPIFAVVQASTILALKEDRVSYHYCPVKESRRPCNS